MGPDFPNVEYVQIRELACDMRDLEESAEKPDIGNKSYMVFLNQTN